MLKKAIANKDGITVEVNQDTGENVGLVVATRNHKTYTPKTVFFENDTYGREMAQDGAYGTISWTIHDGTDTTEADSGNTDGIGVDTNKLRDTGQNFESTVIEGMAVHNTTDNTYSWVTAVNSDTELSLVDDIMDDGEDYIVGPDWIFSEPVGSKWIENDTTQAHDTAKSLLCDNPNINDIMQLLNVNGTDVTLAHFIAISMWIYVGSDWDDGDSFSIYAHNAGVQVNDKVYLEDYFDHHNYNIWQYINIPLVDMGLTTETIDAFRIQNESRGGAKSPKFWIDQIEFRATGTALEYTIKPDQGTWFHIMSYQTLFVDVYDATLADASVPAISYNKIVAMIPTTGYVYKRYSEDKPDPISQYRILSLMDLMSFPQSELGQIISDGNTMVTVSQDQPIPFILKSENLDKMTIDIEDDFSQLLYFRVCVHGYVEQRE